MRTPDAAIHFGSSRAMSCIFRSRRGGYERYYGHLKQYGIEVGIIRRIRMRWVVLANGRRWRRGDLRGSYTGLGAGASVIVGAGANLMVGGQHRRLKLRPFSLESRRGVNVAAGVSRLWLRPRRRN